MQFKIHTQKAFLAGVLLVSGLLPACEDKAKPAFTQCLQDEADRNYLGAEAACNYAVSADPNSTSGQAAAQKLKAIQPQIQTAKANKAIAEQKAAADKTKAEVDTLSTTVSCGRVDIDDDQCVSEGKPPKGRQCTGSTYADNEKVALSKGCQHGYYVSSSVPPDVMFNHYCCPN